MTGLALFVALVAVLAAVALFLQGRTARDQAAEGAARAEKLRVELEKVSKDVAGLRSEAKERREEATGLRAELNVSKKKAYEQAEAAKKAGGAAALRTEIDKLTTRLAEARAEAAHQVERAHAFELAQEKQGKELERLRTAAAASAERKAEPTSPAPAPAIAAPVTADAAAAAAAAQLAVEKDRADKGEAKLTEVKKRLAEVDRDLKGARGRLETEKRVYMVQKGELELANDRHAELRRRYDALRKDHDELLDAVRQAAQEDRRLAGADAAAPGEGGDKPAEGTA